MHTTDGLRQERRARGLDAQPRVYRSAIEVPVALWNARKQLPAPVQDFLVDHFGTQRFLTSPVAVTPGTLQITRPCWTLRRETDVADAALPSILPDLGVYVAELQAAEEEGRIPAVCLFD